MVKPVNPSVEVEVEKIGLTTAGLTVENFANKYQGYVGVQKAVLPEGTTLNKEKYHFRYAVTDSEGVFKKYACTNDQGIAVYGKGDNGNGELDLGSVYTFTEEIDGYGHAVIYGTSDCNSDPEGEIPVVEPVNISVDVTVENVGDMTLGYTESAFENIVYKGYAAVKKVAVPEGMQIDPKKNHFKFSVTGPGVPEGTTACTNNQGYAVYGLNPETGNGTLLYGTTYTFTEEKDGDFARVYKDSACTQISDLDDKAMVKPVDSSVDVTIEKVGLNKAGLNVENYSNEYLGSVGIKKAPSPDGVELNTEKYHFNYVVTGPGIDEPIQICTNDAGYAIYGQDENGNGKLKKGTTYTFTEEIDGSGHAVIYANSDCNSYPQEENIPVVIPKRASVDVTVKNVGSVTLGYNESKYINEIVLGYVGVQKVVIPEGTEYHPEQNHFKYYVTGPGINNRVPVCTNDQGLAIYGRDGYGNGMLELGSTYTFEEEVDDNNFAIIYTSDTCTSINPDYDKIMVQPVNSTVSVRVDHVGLNDIGENISNYPNEPTGYIELRKTVDGQTYASEDYHFKFNVTGPGIEEETSICTNDEGIATYGKNKGGNGTLKVGSVYTFAEEKDGIYAKVYSDDSCTEESEDSNKPMVQPAEDSIEVEVVNGGILVDGLNSEDYDNTSYEYGYAAVHKVVPEGSTLDKEHNHFKYNVSGPGVEEGTTACTNNDGYAVYGLNTETGNGTLERNNVYIFEEEKDPETGLAKVYIDSECQQLSDRADKAMVKPIDEAVSVTIRKIGLNTNGMNVEDYSNEYLGYVGVQKTIEGIPYESEDYHFKYTVTGPGIENPEPVCTNDQGKAVYGLDQVTGNGTLRKGNVYTFTEAIDNDGNAIVYGDSGCLSLADENAPLVKPVNPSIEVEVEEVGSLTLGNNESEYDNTEYQGYAAVQKISTPTGTTIAPADNHFKYTVTGPGIENPVPVCTNDQGLAVYGLDLVTGNGTLPRNGVYTFTEEVDPDGYAVVYRDNTCTGEPKDNSEKPMVKPVTPSVSVIIRNTGLNTAGLNSEIYANKYFGYVGVQKQVGGTNYGSSSYHFRYKVTGPGITGNEYACTNDQGIATYGQDSTGNGTLEQNTSYTFEEVKDNDNHAVVYTDSSCTQESQDVNKPQLYPDTISVTVTSTNVGSMAAGARISTYNNKYENCLAIKKTDSLTNETLSGVEFELFTDSACQTTTGKTATTDTNGIATFNNLTSSTYYAKEISRVPGYTVSEISNCKQVTSDEATSSTSSCRMNTITNDALYIGFYKLKEDGTPLTSATFKVKNQDTNKYVQVSGTYNNCYAYSGETSDAAEASVISVNDISTGLYCIGKIPSGTYTAEEQATGDEGYWFNNGTITGITTSKEIQAVQGDGSNAIKNNPYVVTFYKVREDETNMENATFVIKEKNTTNYITTSGTSNVTGYNGCYIYSGTTTEAAQASQLSSDANGRVCVIRIPNNKHYSVEEKSTGNSAYSINENINIELTPSTSVDSVSNSNKITNYPYYINFFKVDGEENAMEGTKFIVRNTSNEYLVADAPDSQRAKYKDCYIYTGTTSTTGSATEFVSNASGEICIVKTPSDTYTAIETESGNPSYYVDPNNNTIENITTKVIDENETRTSINDQNALRLVNSPYILNFYKTTEDGSTPLDGAKFIVKTTDGKYIKTNGMNTNGCYNYNGTTTVESEGTVFDTTNGEACIVKIPEGTYTVEEKEPAEFHTYGREVVKRINATTTKSARTDLNKFVNIPTEFEFTKTVSEENSYDELWKNLSTEELKKIPFTIYDSNNNAVNVVKTSDGVYEYAGNTKDGVSGAATTVLNLGNNRKLKVYHLPKGTYTIKEEDCCCEDTCESPSSNNCYGFYSPNYSGNSGYSNTFTITECSTSEEVGTDSTGNPVCSTGLATQTLDNTPTEVTFTKKDFYSYIDSSETVKFENDEERSAFDEITFKVFYLDNNNNRVYVDFAKVGDIGTCKTDNSYSEYRYIPEGTTGVTTTKELHTCGGHIRITHLCRGRKYYIEEVSVSGKSVFTLPEREEDRIKEIDLECCQETTSERPSTTTIINDKPTKVKFEKRDSKYGYLINDERTTFEVYRCAEGTTCHPGDYDTVEERAAAGMTLVKFNTRGFITGDEEDSGIEVYRAVTNVDNASNTVTSLHPYQGKLVLRYLESGYNYVLLETESPEGYKLPNGRNAETTFTISTTTVQVDEIDVPNKPTSLIIKKYDEEGNLLEGAKFKIYEGTTCDESLSAKDQPRTLLTLKTIRDGVYENREVKDTDTLITCTDRENNRCSDVVTTLTYDNYVDTWANYNNSVNQENNRVSMEAGEILVQYLEYGKCYIIEEVEAPKGYSLPEKEEDRFVMVTITKESDVVDTGRSLVNKPTPFTFYKFDDYNNLIDGGEFKLQKLNSDKKYEDVTVAREEESGKVYYKVDPNSENKVITTTNGEATVYNLEKGQYRIVETKAPEGMELPIKEINVSIFYVDDNGKVTGNSIITNKPKSGKVIVTPKSSAELVVTISTGMKIVNYGLIILGVLGVTGLLVIVSRRRRENE